MDKEKPSEQDQIKDIKTCIRENLALNIKRNH